MDTIGLYIHIPFCQAKCAYCDFNSFAGGEPLFAPYLAALRTEMALWVERRHPQPRPRFQTVYIGGGTPTVLPADDLAQFLGAVRRAMTLADDAEITVEANPGTVHAGALVCLRQAGITRLSLGVQSFDDALLRILERIHSAAEARTAVRDARAAGFANLNLDLMFGLPGQTLRHWQDGVRQAVELGPEHLSLYALTVETGTPLAAYIKEGTLPAPDDDLAAEMYEWAEQELGQAGYVHYEISNWARLGYACQHNLVYWHNLPYIGLGAGAHSWWKGRRWANLGHPADYIRALDAGRLPIAAEEEIEPKIEMGETMMMGLRLLEEGVSLAGFQQRFGTPLDAVYARPIASLIERGLLERLPDRVRLTQRGHLLGNQVFVEFLL
jgi:oxygen-independent coproporphyrinogen-3 oxidase